MSSTEEDSQFRIAADGLPEPGRERWQPLRGGLLNMYRFDDEEFRYEQGRLLLRGNNGAGKSRVLAMQLPFLLDGEISSSRVEPDGDPAKRMEWNLLLDKYTDRLGYTWIEFGRKSDDGSSQFVTLGCGLHAVQGRGIHGRWYFITPQRIGRDLILAPDRQPLVRSRLEAAVAGRGETFATAEAYRKGVDRALFKLGERYDALIELLIQLRQPKLSRKLDEQQLSDALSEALAPLSPQVLAEVAEAFSSLDSDQRQLDAYRAARDGSDAFLTEYRRYVQIAARRRAEEVHRAQNEYDNNRRRMRKAELSEQEAAAELQRLEDVIAGLGAAEQATQRTIDTLQSSPEMRGAQDLAEAREQAVEWKREAERARKDWDRAVAARSNLDDALQGARDKTEAALSRLQQLLHQAESLAVQTGLADMHRVAIAKIGLPSPTLAALDAAEQVVVPATAERLKAVRHLQSRNVAVQAAQEELSRQKVAYGESQTHLDRAIDGHRGLQERLKQTLSALADAYRTWLSALAELQPTDADELVELLADWSERAEGNGPITAAVQSARHAASERIQRARVDAQHRMQAVRDEILELRERFERIQAGEQQLPPSPYVRDSELRASRAGGPLWSLCDFRHAVPNVERAGLEAALEASGILDAWVTPDGQLLDRAEHDTFVTGGEELLPAEARTLAQALLPSIDQGNPQLGIVRPEVVESILNRIGLGRGTGAVWVDFSGAWQVGPLHGAWQKTSPQYVGHLAREQSRLQLLETLRQQIDRAQSREADIQRELHELDARDQIVREEVARAPSDQPIQRLQAELGAAFAAVATARQQLVTVERRVQAARQNVDDAIRGRDQDARDLQLSSWIDRLSELSAALDDYGRCAAGLWPTVRNYIDVQEQCHNAQDRAEAARLDEIERRGLRDSSAEKVASAEARRDTLQATIGAQVDEVLKQLQTAKGRRENLASEQKITARLQLEVGGRRGQLQQEVKDLQENLERILANRQSTIGRLASFAVTGLLETVHEQLATIERPEWTVARAVEIARGIEAVLAGVPNDDAAWDRSQKEIHQFIEELKDTLLPHGHSPITTSTAEGLFVVVVPFQGRELTVVAFRDALSAEIENRQLLLDAKERQVIENYLIDDVATHLHDLLHTAEKLVRDMNQELESRPMSTGMKLRFVWQPVDDGPSGLPEARRRLLGTGVTWSPDERQALGQFLQQQIKDVRAANQTGGWHEHLTAALDYRKWHRFGVDRQQDGHWKRLTKRTYGTGSGGEKAITLTIPLFAAASAHYRSADRLAPRLILLDEAFVGVDGDMRSKCMGLLTAFDLDFAMTSEREWGCYPTVPGLAIYQLAAKAGIDAVYASRWVWNGHELRPDEAHSVNGRHFQRTFLHGAADAENGSERPRGV